MVQYLSIKMDLELIRMENRDKIFLELIREKRKVGNDFWVLVKLWDVSR